MIEPQLGGTQDLLDQQRAHHAGSSIDEAELSQHIVQTTGDGRVIVQDATCSP